MYKGNMKLVRNGRPYGDGIWYLYDLSVDPGETNDLSQSDPQGFAEMIKHYDDYTTQYGVLEMGINYMPLQEIQNKLIAQLKTAIRPWLLGIAVIIIGLFIRRRIRRKKRILAA